MFENDDKNEVGSSNNSQSSNETPNVSIPERVTEISTVVQVRDDVPDLTIKPHMPWKYPLIF
jgi:hypothetical protein